jgi:uncharacterized short protein YbdD (DUF466 family)
MRASAGQRPMATGRPPGGILAAMERVLRVVRTVIGAPDYERYVQHMSVHHPGCELASRDEFMRQRLESRYSRPGSRCC